MSIKVYTLDHHFLGYPNSIGSFLIESQEGLILVESGPHSTYKNLRKAISNAGFDVKNVKYVLLTHIHLDHAGAAWVFAEMGAHIYVHTLGYQHMLDPSRLYASAKMIYKENMETLWGEMKAINAKQLHVVKDEDIIDIGEHRIEAIYTPGHAKHHLSWRLGDTIFTGDVAGARINLGPVAPPCPPPDIDIELWLSSIERLLSVEGIKRYYLTHYGVVTDIDAHMAQLKASLIDYKEFVKPYYEKGTPTQEVIPDFIRFVDERLTKMGMPEADRMSYQAANPADMSVTGLFRYWSKQESRKN